MNFLWNALINLVVSVIISELTRPKIDTNGPPIGALDDFDFPSAQDRPVQVIYGKVRMTGPNVITYCDLQHERITKTVKDGLFHKKRVPIGTKYFLGLDLALGHGEIDELYDVSFGAKQAWSGSILGDGEFTIDAPMLFGGDENGGRGGVGGVCRFYSGSKTQEVDPYMASVAPVEVSPYRGVAHLVLERFYVGNATSVDPISMTVRRTPKSPTGQTQYEIIGDGDANPAYIIYDLATSHEYGASMPGALINIDAIEAAAARFHEEGFGLSMIINQQQSVGQVIEEVCRHIGAFFRPNYETGLIDLKPIRDDYTFEDLPVIDGSIAKVNKISRGSSSSSVGEVRVKYTDRESLYKQRQVIAQDLGIQRERGEVESVNLEFPSITNGALATQVAMRELIPYVAKLATVDLECNRKVHRLKPGDVCRVNLPEEGITDLVIRISDVGLGELERGRIRIAGMQDVFKLSRAVYMTPPPPVWDFPTSGPAVVPTNIRIVEAPQIISGTDQQAVMPLVAKPNQSQEFLEIYTSNSPDGPWYRQTIEPQYTPMTTLVDPLPLDSDGGGYTDGPITLFDAEAASGLSSAMAHDIRKRGENLALLDGPSGIEWIAFESVSVSGGIASIGGIHRGLFDSTARAHTAGTKIWIVSESMASTSDAWDIGDHAYIKTATVTRIDKLSLDDAPSRDILVTGSGMRPLSALIKSGTMVSGERVIKWVSDGEGGYEDLAIELMPQVRGYVALPSDDSSPYGFGSMDRISVVVRNLSSSGAILKEYEVGVSDLEGGTTWKMPFEEVSPFTDLHVTFKVKDLRTGLDSISRSCKVVAPSP